MLEHRQDLEPVVIMRIRSDSEGAFELRRSHPGERLELLARHPEQAPLRQPFEAGEDELMLTMADGLALEGRILFDPELDPRRLWLQLSGDAPQQPAYPARLDEEGRFRFFPYHAGRGELLLLGLGWVGEPLVLLEDLHLTPELEADARLLSIDLRGELTVTRLRARDPQGATLGRLTLHRADGGATTSTALELPSSSSADAEVAGPSSSSGPEAAEHLLVHAGEPRTIEVEAPGLRRVPLLLSGGTRELVLGRGLPVELTFLGLDELPPGCSVGVRLRPEDRSQDPLVAGAPEGVAQLELPLPGTWTGHVTIIHLAGNRRTSRRGQELRLELDDTAEVQRFSISLDAVTFERAQQMATE